ncbi:lipocalin-like domain-containing protein [Chloroflexota bacterium]
MAKGVVIKIAYFMAVLLAIVMIINIIKCSVPDGEPQEEKIDVIAALSGGNTEGYSIADEPIEFVFPDDHGAHEGFRNEWWYFTGNLYDRNGRRFGYQLTIFRIALSPLAPERESYWATNQIYMAHFTISDAENREFYCFEKFNRQALGLAGFQDEGFGINVEGWSITGADSGNFPWQLYAEKNDITLSIEVNPLKDIVLQGENGLSRKSLGEGNASYYYSITRLATEGYIEIEGEKYDVSGNSWLDREWSTSALSQEQGGWDWFSMQLDDGTDIVYFQLRYKDGSPYPYNEGLIVDAGGNTVKLGTNDIPLKVTKTWQSPLGGVYPVEWQAEIVPLGKTVIIGALFPEQELDLSTRYWEGAVNIYDKENPAKIIGTGYMELTGYAAVFSSSGS